jgi:hypothetical protein
MSRGKREDSSEGSGNSCREPGTEEQYDIEIPQTHLHNIVRVCDGDRYALLVSTTALRSNMRVLLVSE